MREKYKVTHMEDLDIFTFETSDKCIRMQCGHGIPKYSLYAYCLSQFQSGNKILRCPHLKSATNNQLCRKMWNFQIVRKVLLFNNTRIANNNVHILQNIRQQNIQDFQGIHIINNISVINKLFDQPQQNNHQSKQNNNNYFCGENRHIANNNTISNTRWDDTLVGYLILGYMREFIEQLTINISMIFYEQLNNESALYMIFEFIYILFPIPQRFKIRKSTVKKPRLKPKPKPTPEPEPSAVNNANDPIPSPVPNSNAVIISNPIPIPIPNPNPNPSVSANTNADANQNTVIIAAQIQPEPGSTAAELTQVQTTHALPITQTQTEADAEAVAEPGTNIDANANPNTSSTAAAAVVVHNDLSNVNVHNPSNIAVTTDLVVDDEKNQSDAKQSEDDRINAAADDDSHDNGTVREYENQIETESSSTSESSSESEENDENEVDDTEDMIPLTVSMDNNDTQVLPAPINHTHHTNDNVNVNGRGIIQIPSKVVNHSSNVDDNKDNDNTAADALYVPFASINADRITIGAAGATVNDAMIDFSLLMPAVSRQASLVTQDTLSLLSPMQSESAAVLGGYGTAATVLDEIADMNNMDTPSILMVAVSVDLSTQSIDIRPVVDPDADADADVDGVPLNNDNDGNNTVSDDSVNANNSVSMTLASMDALQETLEMDPSVPLFAIANIDSMQSNLTNVSQLSSSTFNSTNSMLRMTSADLADMNEMNMNMEMDMEMNVEMNLNRDRDAVNRMHMDEHEMGMRLGYSRHTKGHMGSRMSDEMRPALVRRQTPQELQSAESELSVNGNGIGINANANTSADDALLSMGVIDNHVDIDTDTDINDMLRIHTINIPHRNHMIDMIDMIGNNGLEDVLRVSTVTGPSVVMPFEIPVEIGIGIDIDDDADDNKDDEKASVVVLPEVDAEEEEKKAAVIEDEDDDEDNISVEQIQELELLCARNLFIDKFDFQQCPKCKSILFRKLAKMSKLVCRVLCPMCDADLKLKLQTQAQVTTRRRRTTTTTTTTTNSSESKEEENNNIIGNGNRADSEQKTNATTNVNANDNASAAVAAAVAGAVPPPPPLPMPSKKLTKLQELEKQLKLKTLTRLQRQKLERRHKLLVCKQRKNKRLDKKSKFFCWACSQSWKSKKVSALYCGNHNCSISFMQQTITVLRECKTKRIGSLGGVPDIRACPKCSMLISHISACKHVTCYACKTRFCFVCLKLYDVKHNRWLCGHYSSHCPIYPRQGMESLPSANRNAVKLF